VFVENWNLEQDGFQSNATQTNIIKIHAQRSQINKGPGLPRDHVKGLSFRKFFAAGIARFWVPFGWLGSESIHNALF
jgi:hypothetical protein